MAKKVFDLTKENRHAERNRERKPLSKGGKFKYQTITPERFTELRQKANLTVDEFRFIAGRSPGQMTDFLKNPDPGDRRLYSPTMGDAVIIELLAIDPSLAELMRSIAMNYVILEGN